MLTAIPDQEAKEKGRVWIDHPVEVFSVGTWNGLDFDESDLQTMCEAFEATLPQIDPVVITNHGQDSQEGKTRGFVGRLWTNEKPFVDRLGQYVEPGQRLLATLLVDEDLHEDVKSHSYGKVSAELFPGYKDLVTGKVYDWVLTAVSFQGGANLPAVRNLRPIAEPFTSNKVPLHFRSNGKAVMIEPFSNKRGEKMAMPDQKEEVKMADPVPVPADLSALMTEILSVLKGVGEGLSALKDSVDSLTDEEVKEEDAKPEDVPPVEMEAKERPVEKSAEFAAMERRVQAAEKLAREEKALRLLRDRESSARKFVESISTEKCHKIPMKSREQAIQLLVNANDSATVKFAQGKDYTQALQEFLSGLPDLSVMFKDSSSTFVGFDKGGLEAVSDVSAFAQMQSKANQMLADGKVKTFAEAITLVGSQNPELYNQYRYETSQKGRS